MEHFKPMFRDVRGFENSQKLEAHFLSKEDGGNSLAGIQFDDSLINQLTVASKLKITIRFPAELRIKHDSTWKTNHLFPIGRNRHRANFSAVDRNPSLFDTS